jgi:hypothetical protein
MRKLIKQGNHISNYIPKLTFSNKIKGSVTFEGDFSYSIDKQKDTNKLIGLSDSWSHHISSIRIGWRWNKKSECIELMSILYSEGKREIKPLLLLSNVNTISYEVEILPENYRIVINDVSYLIDRKSKWNFLRVKLQPYFGGTTVAPKDFSFNFF